MIGLTDKELTSEQEIILENYRYAKESESIRNMRVYFVVQNKERFTEGYARISEKKGETVVIVNDVDTIRYIPYDNVTRMVTVYPENKESGD